MDKHPTPNIKHILALLISVKLIRLTLLVPSANGLIRMTLLVPSANGRG